MANKGDDNQFELVHRRKSPRLNWIDSTKITDASGEKVEPPPMASLKTTTPPVSPTPSPAHTVENHVLTPPVASRMSARVGDLMSAALAEAELAAAIYTPRAKLTEKEKIPAATETEPPVTMASSL